MFKQRLWTTLIAAPLVLLMIYFSPSWILALVLVAIIALCAWEWTKLIPLKSLHKKLSFIVVILGLCWVCGLYFNLWLIIGLWSWVIVLVAVITFPASQRYWGNPVIVSSMGFLFLPLFCNAVVQIHQYRYGDHLLGYAFALVWSVDIGAYVVGKGVGQRKLIPTVSPGKTLEGVLGGCFFAAIIALIGGWAFSPLTKGLWGGVALGMVFISMVGDLFISMLKRRVKLKDSGFFLPGHGGVLDRLDSSIAALPFFCFSLVFLEFWH